MYKYYPTKWLYKYTCCLLSCEIYEPKLFMRIVCAWAVQSGISRHTCLNFFQLHQAWTILRIRFKEGFIRSQGCNFSLVNKAEFNHGVEKAPCNQPIIRSCFKFRLAIYNYKSTYWAQISQIIKVRILTIGHYGGLVKADLWQVYRHACYMPIDLLQVACLDHACMQLSWVP
jgi:hypothetical protein